MTTNDFLAWAVGGGANVETPAQLAADPAFALGFVAGIAPSKTANTVWRQPSFVAAALSQFIADQLGGATHVADDGVVANYEAQLQAALKAIANQYAADTGAANVYSGTYVPAITSHVVGLPLFLKIAHANTGASTFNPGPSAKTITRQDGTALQANDLLAGQVVLLIYDGVNYQTFVKIRDPYVLIQDQKASGTPGGTFTSGAWRTRDLNTLVVDTAGIVSAFAANQFTIPAGTYRVSAYAIAEEVDTHQTRLFNITDNATLVTGLSSECTTVIGTTPDQVGTPSLLTGYFTLAAPKVIQLQHQSGVTSTTTSGFGAPGSFGTEVYSSIELWKVG